MNSFKNNNIDKDNLRGNNRGRSRKKPDKNRGFRLIFLIAPAILLAAGIFIFKPFGNPMGTLSNAFNNLLNLNISPVNPESQDNLYADGGSDYNGSGDSKDASGDYDDSDSDGIDGSQLSDGGTASDDASPSKGKYSDLLSDPELMAAENCLPLTDDDDGVITIRFAGDLLLDDSYAVAASIKERSGGTLDAEYAFDEEMLRLMREADIFMLNNEFPYTVNGEPIEGKQFTFRADPSDTKFLQDIGADIVSLANNHSYDFGEISLLDSLDALDEAGIAYVGAGRDISEASAPIYLVSDNVRIAIIASTQIERMPNPDTKGADENTPGVFRSMDLTALLEVIKEAKEVSDYCIVFTHWGTEGEEETDWSQNEQAPLIAEAGADLIIGAHPHVLQKIEYIGDTPVFYSIGNFLFNSKTLNACLAEVNIDAESGDLLSLRFIPTLQSNCQTVTLSGDDYTAALNDMRSLSPDIEIDDEGFITKKQ